MSKKFMRAAALMSALSMLAAAPAAATESDADASKNCMESAYSNYNVCLTSSFSPWARALCDVSFQINVMACAASQ